MLCARTGSSVSKLPTPTVKLIGGAARWSWYFETSQWSCAASATWFCAHEFATPRCQMHGRGEQLFTFVSVWVQSPPLSAWTSVEAGTLVVPSPIRSPVSDTVCAYGPFRVSAPESRYGERSTVW